jgi:hypothetical protein
MGSKRISEAYGIFTLGIALAAAVAMPARAATIVVDTPSQAVDGTDGHCSLPEAIYAANFDASIAIQTTNPDAFIATECTAGSGDDTIQINLPAPNVITMISVIDDAHNPMGPTGTPIVFSNITIEGNGVQLIHGGIFNDRAFAVGSAIVDLHPAGLDRFAAGTGALTIHNTHVQGFTIKGGNGTEGGGGGLGAGGAIYVMGGSLTVEGCTFQANGAVGGNGSHRIERAAGGGGGLSGDGGAVGSGAAAARAATAEAARSVEHPLEPGAAAAEPSTPVALAAMSRLEGSTAAGGVARTDFSTATTATTASASEEEAEGASPAVTRATASDPETAATGVTAAVAAVAAMTAATAATPTSAAAAVGLRSPRGCSARTAATADSVEAAARASTRGIRDCSPAPGPKARVEGVPHWAARSSTTAAPFTSTTARSPRTSPRTASGRSIPPKTRGRLSFPATARSRSSTRR